MSNEKLILRTFEDLDTEFEFQVLRGQSNIPHKCSIQNDIDLIIKKYDYDNVISFMGDLGYAIHFDNEKYLYGAVSHIHCVNNNADVHFDIVAGLYYRSIDDQNIFVGGYEELETSLWNNKQKVDEPWKYNPGVEDQLTHICCHSIFDTRGVPEKYRSKIKSLYLDSDKNVLQALFAYAFYKAGDHLLSIISGNDDVSKLFDEYVAFSKY